MNKLHFYTTLAKHYDKIYGYLNYDVQWNFLIKSFNHWKKSPNNRVLDIACGTGTHADFLQKKGFDVVGIDISEDMIAEARKKNSNVTFTIADMKNFNTPQKFGAVICFFNSILYNKNKQEMTLTLDKVYNHLEDGGIFIFDMMDKSIGINCEKRRHEEGNIIFEWQGLLSEDFLNILVDITIDGEKYHDKHVLGAFSMEELKKIVENVGFSVDVLKGGFEESKDPKEKKAIFICLKEIKQAKK